MRRNVTFQPPCSTSNCRPAGAKKGRLQAPPDVAYRNYSLKPPEQCDRSTPEQGHDYPFVHPEHFRQTDLAKVIPRQNSGLHGRIQLGIDRRADKHAGNGKKGMATPHPQRPDRCAGTETHHRPAAPEQCAANQYGTHIHRFVAQLDNLHVCQQHDAHHANHDGRHHELENGHILEQHGTQLFVKAQHPALLQQKTECKPGCQSQ